MKILAALPVILLIGLLTAAFAVRCTIFSELQVRRMRWRTLARVRPGPGFATWAEMWWRWGRLAAVFRYGRQVRPGMPLRTRLAAPTTEFAVRLGRGPYYRRCYTDPQQNTLYLAPPRTGKALALNTPVPTPNGWTTIGEIASGDMVFGADGQPVKVIGAWEIMHDRPCYDVEFSDGTIITADADHLWETWSPKARESRCHSPGTGVPKIVTTAQIADGDLRAGRRFAHAVKLAGAVQWPKRDLHVDPYVLGYWLSDGETWKGRVSIPPGKQGVLSRLTMSYRLGSCGGKSSNHRLLGLQADLRLIGVLGDKHVPADYLSASAAQRLALLQGLMDGDGCATKRGHSRFTNTNERIIDAVCVLVASLGGLALKRPCWTRPGWRQLYRVEISGLTNPFHLERKASRVAATRIRQPRFRTITAVRRAPSVPVRCITVDAADGMYLVSEACLPTHNSGMLGDRVIDHPGPAVIHETRPDGLWNTAGYRARLGPVSVFNPDNVGGIASSFGWDIVSACIDPAEALYIANDLTDTVADTGEMQWWVTKAAAALAAGVHAAGLLSDPAGGAVGALASKLHAAAVTGDMAAVFRWAYGNRDLIHAVNGHPGASHALIGALAELERPGKTSDSVKITMSKALAWMAVPSLAAMVTGPQARPFDVPAWIESGGTIYMVSPGGEQAPAAPLFRCFTSYVHRHAKEYAQTLPSRKLDPPLLFALDELHRCPIDLPLWLGDSAGSGIQIAAVVHSTGQLRDKYGDPGLNTIWNTCGTKIFLPGNHNAETLQDVSVLCGTLPGGEARGLNPIVPVEYIARGLPRWRALVLNADLSPLVVKTRPSWHRTAARLHRVPPPPILLADAQNTRERDDLSEELAALTRRQPAAARNGHRPSPLPEDPGDAA